MFDIDMLFADGSPFYCKYIKEENKYDAILRFRTGKSEDIKVYVETKKGSLLMNKEMRQGNCDYYKVKISDCRQGEHYYFKIQGHDSTVFFNKRGPMQENQSFYDFVFIPEFDTPDWAKGAIFYQIFTDRFCNGNADNDVLDDEYVYIKSHSVHVKDWDSYPKAMDVGRFYGGDLQGVMMKLDYLKSLGVDVIYLNPIFVSPSNHKYDIQDYDYVDPHLAVIVYDEGDCLKATDKDNKYATKYRSRVTDKRNLEASNAYFIQLVEAIHARGMKVILDGVFNHCGSFNKWMDRECLYEHQDGYEAGAFISEESPYHDFFKFKENSRWPYNKKYDGWWGHDTLPKLNYEQSERLEDYILRIGAKWVSPPFNADGWRLDVAADLGQSPEYNHQFWKKFRKAVKAANPNAIILAEHYGDPAAWLQGDEWDTVMNYDAFMEPVTWFLTGMEKHSDEYRDDLFGNDVTFRDAMSHHMSRMHWPSIFVSMNELSNHDHSRFLTRTNHLVGRVANLGNKAAEENVDISVMRMAVLMQMTWPGAPTIYYGDEAGVCGFTDPDNRRTYPWGHENHELIEFHKAAIDMHKLNSVFSMGSFKYLYGQKNFISYCRFMVEKYAIIAVHIGDGPLEVNIPVYQSGIENGQYLQIVFITDRDGYQTEGRAFKVENGHIHVIMPAKSAMVMINKK